MSTILSFGLPLRGLGIYFAFCFLLTLPSGVPIQQTPLFNRFTYLLIIARFALNILDVINPADMLVVSTRLLSCKSSSPFTNPLMAVRSELTKIGITIIFLFHSFSVLQQSLYTPLSSRFISVLPCNQPEKLITLFGRFSLICWLLLGIDSGRD